MATASSLDPAADSEPTGEGYDADTWQDTPGGGPLLPGDSRSTLKSAGIVIAAGAAALIAAVAWLLS